MLGSPALDVFIGLSFIFLVLSLVASGVQEVFQAVLGLRGKNLRNGIKQLLRDPAISALIQDALAKTGMAKDDLAKKNLADALYSHPLVAARSALHGPSYLKPATFALALIDVLRQLPETAKAVETVKNQLATKAAEAAAALEAAKIQGAADAPAAVKALEVAKAALAQADSIWGSADAIVKALPDGPVRQQLLLILANAEPEKVKEAIELWFETTMDRIEGWFKRRTLLISVSIGIAIAAVGNVDAIGLTRYLADSPAARAALVEQAEQSMATLQKTIEAIKPCEANAQPDDPCKTNAVTLDTAQKNLNASVAMASSAVSAGMLPFGWSDETMPVAFWGWLSRIVGLLLTAIAISVGAPFWFSMLQKLMSFRASGVNPKEKKEKEEKQKKEKQ
jgi:hypothetical protein